MALCGCCLPPTNWTFTYNDNVDMSWSTNTSNQKSPNFTQIEKKTFNVFGFHTLKMTVRKLVLVLRNPHVKYHTLSFTTLKSTDYKLMTWVTNTDHLHKLMVIINLTSPSGVVRTKVQPALKCQGDWIKCPVKQSDCLTS